jgi:peptidoglycan hydrolase-like protein with peptidoglycan-binding domain
MTRSWFGRSARGRRTLALLLAPLALASLGGCVHSGESTAAAEAPSTSQRPVQISPLPAATAQSAATVEPASTGEQATAAAPTTVPPTSEAPTTLPATTEAPTTTAEPTTTTAAPTTTLAVNIEPVPAAPVAFAAVGRAGGKATAAIQARLLEIGLWNAGPTGNYDLTTTQAVMAFQKYMGLSASGKVDQPTAQALQTVTERPHATTTVGDMVEVDKDKQLVFIVRGGRTLWTINASTGSGKAYAEPDKNHPGEIQSGVAITVVGLWKVTLERPDGWWPGDLGQIYRPKYFHGGEAVHGSNDVPNHPASHGCVRVSVPAMDFIWANDLMPLKSPVWVHGG